MHSIALLLIAAAFGTRIAAVPRHPIIQEGDDVIVNIEDGALRGVVATSLNGVLYNKFLGIPYATPPLGDLRFRAPQPSASWSGVRDALSFADVCAQPLFYGLIPITTGSEDCLYLNVYAPAAESGPYPVMVYIHGGAFKGGSSSGATPHSFVEKGVVLVTIAYRLGALGFLSLLNDDIPGNAGFKDQVLALQWVQRNIAAFGGDPSSVVIFGESAGGGSTSHLFLSPTAKDCLVSVRFLLNRQPTSDSVWRLPPPIAEKILYKPNSCPNSLWNYQFSYQFQENYNVEWVLTNSESN